MEIQHAHAARAPKPAAPLPVIAAAAAPGVVFLRPLRMHAAAAGPQGRGWRAMMRGGTQTPRTGSPEICAFRP